MEYHRGLINARGNVVHGALVTMSTKSIIISNLIPRPTYHYLYVYYSVIGSFENGSTL